MSQQRTFRKKIAEAYDSEELKVLTFDLGIQYDELPGDRLSRKIAALCVAVYKADRFDVFHKLLTSERSDWEWPTVEEIKGYDWVELAKEVDLPPSIQQWIENVETIVVGEGAIVNQYGLTVEEVTALYKELQTKDQPKVWNGDIPYLGLKAFQKSDAKYFFGREALVEELLEKIGQTNFLTIAGPSGSGKSSLVRAGLFHALEEGQLEKSGNWLLGAMTPQGDPIGELATLVGRLAKSPAAKKYILENRDDPAALQEQIDMILSPDDPEQQCVLLIDQFEEIFTQTRDDKTRESFIALLTQAAEVDVSRIKIILAMRADFVSNLARHPQLRALVNRQFQLVGAMEPEDLAKAITLPALEVGAEIDPQLVAQIVNDMKGEPGALPLMSFALRDLFIAEKSEKGESMDMTLPEYLDRGGIESALERHANQVFKEFSAEQQELTKNIFSKLIEVGRGRVDTRRTANFGELVPSGSDDTAVREIVDKLADQNVRLIATSGIEAGEDVSDAPAIEGTVSIAHEKLIDAWPWLRQLVDENREIIALQNQIAAEAQAWEAENDDGYLLRGGRLLNVEEQLEQLRPGLDERSSRFIETSIEARQKEIEEKEAQQKALLDEQRLRAEEANKRAQAEEVARQQAVKDAQRVRNRNRIAIGLAGLASLLAVVSFIFFRQANESANEAQIAATNEAVIRVTSQHNESMAQTRAVEELQSAEEALENALEAERSAAEAKLNGELAIQAQGTAEYNEQLARENSILANNQAQLAQAQALLSSSISLLPQNRYPTYTETQRSRLMVIQGVRLNDLIPDQMDINFVADQASQAIEALRSKPQGHMIYDHEDWARSVAFSPDGSKFVSVSHNGTIQLHEPNNLDSEPLVWSAHDSWIMSVAFAPDSEIFATGSLDQKIYLWDVSDVTDPIEILEGHEDGVTAVAFSNEEARLASGSDDGTVLIWNLEDLTADPLMLERYDGIVNAVMFSPNGEFLVSANDDGSIWLWQTDNFEDGPEKYQGHEDFAISVAFSPDSEILATGGSNGMIRLWNPNNMSSIPQTIQGHKEWVRSLSFSPDNKHLASGSGDRTIRIWDLDDLTAPPTIIDAFEGLGFVLSIAYSPDGKILASGSGAGVVHYWDLTDPRAEPTKLEGYNDWVDSIAYSPDGEEIASGGGVDDIRIWTLGELSRGALIIEGSDDYGSVESIAYSPNGRFLAIGNSQGQIGLWETTNPTLEMRLFEGHAGWVQAVAFSPNGEVLASGGEDRVVRLWDISDLSADPKILRGVETDIYSISFSYDGKYLAAGEDDGQIHIWDLTDPSVDPVPLHRHRNTVWSVAFSPVENLLATGSSDKKIMLWEVTDLTAEPRTLEGHEKAVRSVAFAPDGKTLASASEDETIRLWSIGAEANAPRIMEGHEEEVRVVAFSPDGNTLASGGADQRLILWPTLDWLVEQSCQRVERNFTWEEWGEFLSAFPYQKTCNDLPVHCTVPLEQWPEDYLDWREERAACYTAEEIEAFESTRDS